MHEIQQFLLDNVASHPSDLVKVAMEHFKVTRAAVFFHVQKLREANLIQQEGTRNKVRYFPAKQTKKKQESQVTRNRKQFYYEVGKKGEDEIWREDIRPVLGDLKKNVEEILRYGFTEMFNNVIDHSGSKQAAVDIEYLDRDLIISIYDDGIGVFQKIANYFKYQDIREAVIKLHQGKVTTDSSKHSGQGIFFTSRAVDKFNILANGYFYTKENTKEDEWYWESQEAEANIEGTIVRLRISKDSSRNLKDVFDAYTSSEDFSFNKSHIRIALGKYEEESFVSRSQAKRLLSGLDDFKTILLDFKNIKNVGQAFVDEVLGVFGFEHPDVRFIVLNANSDIIFMLKRGIADRKFPAKRILFGDNNQLT